MTPAVRAAASSSTPVVDAALLNPLAVPPGVGIWLREWERRLRAALRSVNDAVDPRHAVPAWDEAVEELRGIDPDDPNGVFRHLLHRPLWQLEEGSAARETFERYAHTVLERLEAARALVHEVEPLLAERERLVEEFGARFPNRLAEQLADVRARDADIARLRRAVDAIRMRTRFARARRALEVLAGVLSDKDCNLSSDTLVEGETETLFEMAAALAVARRLRRQLEVYSAAPRAHRARLIAELRGLALSAPDSARPSSTNARRTGHTAIVLEQLVHAVAAAGGATLEGGDAPLLTGALSAALSMHHPGLDRFAWLPALLGGAPDATDAAALSYPEVDLLHVVPLGGNLLYLSPEPESAIRVHTRSVRLGETAEYQVAPDMVERRAHGLTDADVSFMFDGVDEIRSRWYATTVRGRARIVARHRGGWFARLERKGTVTPLDQASWHADGPGAAFRLLRPAPRFTAKRGHADGAKDAELVAATRDAPHSTFMGFTLREVRTGLLGDERAWARGITGPWQGSGEAVEREAELFARLQARVHDAPGRRSDLALRPVAWARLPEEVGTYPLYRAPLATLDSPGRLRSWVTERDEHLIAVLTAVSRIITHVHASGFALGVYHSEAFAYGLGWDPHPLTPMPTALLAHAPCATRLGEPFVAPGAASMTPAYYTMLRTPILVPQVAASQPATVERDMQGFGAFVLDLLLESPIFARGTLDWYDAPAVVRARASQCSAHPTLVKQLGDQVPEPMGWRRIREMVERLAGGKARTVAELM